MKTTILCLLYGDYPYLARRCLTPLGELHNKGYEVRIGCNEVSPETTSIVETLFPKSDRLTVLTCTPQVYKYPMMDLLLKVKPITTEYVMWFDDDSYILDKDRLLWMQEAEARMQFTGADVMGAVYFLPVLPGQSDWRRLQCGWYTDKKIPGRARTMFPTGGWWVIKSSVLEKYEWPHPMLKHNGGDVLLGELIDHQKLKLINYRKGVAINADDDGKESGAKRRGYTERPIGTI